QLEIDLGKRLADRLAQTADGDRHGNRHLADARHGGQLLLLLGMLGAVLMGPLVFRDIDHELTADDFRLDAVLAELGAVAALGVTTVAAGQLAGARSSLALARLVLVLDIRGRRYRVARRMAVDDLLQVGLAAAHLLRWQLHDRLQDRLVGRLLLVPPLSYA